MGQQTRDQDDLRLYLLGLLPQDRQRPLEERLLTESSFYEELLIAEEELIDDYLAGALPRRERGVFETRFASTAEGLREVRFASALRNYAARNARPAGEGAAKFEPAAEAAARGGGLLARLRPRGLVPSFSLAVAALLLVCVASWLVFRVLTPRGPREVVTVVLSARTVTRGDGENVPLVVVPAGTDEMRLQLSLTEDGFESYRAALHRADGSVALTTGPLQPETTANGERVVVVSVPADVAPAGDYHLRLSGVAAGDTESAGSYRFRVVSR